MASPLLRKGRHGDSKCKSQVTEEVCGGAAVCWPQAGLQIFEPSFSYLEAKVGGHGRPLQSEVARPPWLHLALPMPSKCFLSKVCVQDLIFKTRIQLRAIRKVSKNRGHLITISGTVADSPRAQGSGLWFLLQRTAVWNTCSPIYLSPTWLLSAEVVRYNNSVASVTGFISSFDCSDKGLGKYALVLDFLPLYF